jgi:hypothetical protein
MAQEDPMADMPEHVAKALPEFDTATQGRFRDMYERSGNMTFGELSAEMRDWSGREATVTEIPGPGDSAWEVKTASGALEFDPADYTTGDHTFGLSCGDALQGGWDLLISDGDPIRRADDGAITWVSNGGAKVLDVQLNAK